jgi:hypothetical protein
MTPPGVEPSFDTRRRAPHVLPPQDSAAPYAPLFKDSVSGAVPRPLPSGGLVLPPTTPASTTGVVSASCLMLQRYDASQAFEGRAVLGSGVHFASEPRNTASVLLRVTGLHVLPATVGFVSAAYWRLPPGSSATCAAGSGCVVVFSDVLSELVGGLPDVWATDACSWGDSFEYSRACFQKAEGRPCGNPTVQERSTGIGRE